MPLEQPFAYTVAEAAAASRCSRTALYLALKSGALKARKRGARTVILRHDLTAWLNGLPEYTPATGHATA